MTIFRGLTRAGAVLVLALLALFAPSAATAHDQLIESFPADGDVLTEIPAQLSLEFSDEIIPMSPAVLIQDSAQVTVYEAEPELAGRLATSPFPELADGAYALNWSVVSADGHRIEGSIPFEMATGLAPSAPADAVDAAPADAGPAATAPTSEPAEPQDTMVPADGMQGLPLWVKLTLMAAATASILTLILLRFRRRPPTTPSSGNENS